MWPQQGGRHSSPSPSSAFEVAPGSDDRPISSQSDNQLELRLPTPTSDDSRGSRHRLYYREMHNRTPSVRLRSHTNRVRRNMSFREITTLRSRVPQNIDTDSIRLHTKRQPVYAMESNDSDVRAMSPMHCVEGNDERICRLDDLPVVTSTCSHCGNVQSLQTREAQERSMYRPDLSRCSPSTRSLSNEPSMPNAPILENSAGPENSLFQYTTNTSPAISEPQDVNMSLKKDELLCKSYSSDECISSVLLAIQSSISPLITYTSTKLKKSLVSPRVMQVTNRVIRHARLNKVPNDSSVRCPDCEDYPLLPVTGKCGHTRCTKCVKEHGACPCGGQPPVNMHVNTVVQDLVRKLRPIESSSRVIEESLHHVEPLRRSRRSMVSPHVWRGRVRRGLDSSPMSRTIAPRTPLTPQARLQYGWDLISAERYHEAIPYLARAAGSGAPASRRARPLLARTISHISNARDPRRLTRWLFRLVREESAIARVTPSDLECVLCCHTYTMPVTTPCGHTYCRTCIERSMDYRMSCALCLRSLKDFDLAGTNDTVFISAALESIGCVKRPAPPDPNVIPVIVCTVAYPVISCPLFIFDPRYWMMIRRVLESGSRKFGMVAYERYKTYSDYGTKRAVPAIYKLRSRDSLKELFREVLEVRDCVHLEDGRMILSTIGVSRFKVIERDVRDGCDVARIQPLTDITPTEELVIKGLRLMREQLIHKALLWLTTIGGGVIMEIEAALGQIPEFENDEEVWWETPDGPAWLWWLIAILPLRSEIKVLMLSTNNLLKRMTAVSRTLEAIFHVALTTASETRCEPQGTLHHII